jgi:hypothetical protein
LACDPKDNLTSTSISAALTFSMSKIQSLLRKGDRSLLF